MKKLIKILIIINVVLCLASGILYLGMQHQDPSDGFNGLIFAYPLLSIGLTIILLLGLVFIRTIKTVMTKPVTTNNQRYKNIVLSILVSFVPLLLLYYSYTGENRAILKIISMAGLILAYSSAIYHLVTRPKKK